MILRVLFVVVLLAGAAAAYLYQQWQTRLDTAMALPDAGTELIIAPGEPLRAIAARLAARGLLEHGLDLELLARRTDQAAAIKAGTYHVAAGTTPRQLLALLVSGEVRQYTITFVEGWTFRQLLAAIHADARIMKTLDTQARIMPQLGLSQASPEGWFLPETYQFTDGSTDRELLLRAHRAMQTLLAESWAERDRSIPLKTPEEALILASIVEKETGAAHERAAIAGVFTRRLQLNMKLQTDPTVIYGIGAAFDGNLTRKHLREDTPYNTYVHRGLPPTPIAMPGRAALAAVMHPADGKALYFVARGDGTHQFSATLAEHNAAVRKYQLKK